MVVVVVAVVVAVVVVGCVAHTPTLTLTTQPCLHHRNLTELEGECCGLALRQKNLEIEINQTCLRGECLRCSTNSQMQQENTNHKKYSFYPQRENRLESMFSEMFS